MSCLLILNPLKHNVYCVYQLLSYAKGFHLPVNCICDNVCVILRINIIHLVILAAFTGTSFITMKMLKQYRYVSEADCFLFHMKPLILNHS